MSNELEDVWAYLRARATWWDRLNCRLFGHTSAHAMFGFGRDLGFCFRCGSKTNVSTPTTHAPDVSQKTGNVDISGGGE